MTCAKKKNQLDPCPWKDKKRPPKCWVMDGENIYVCQFYIEGRGI